MQHTMAGLAGVERCRVEGGHCPEIDASFSDEGEDAGSRSSIFEVNETRFIQKPLTIFRPIPQSTVEDVVPPPTQPGR